MCVNGDHFKCCLYCKMCYTTERVLVDTYRQQAVSPLFRDDDSDELPMGMTTHDIKFCPSCFTVWSWP